VTGPLARLTFIGLILLLTPHIVLASEDPVRLTVSDSHQIAQNAYETEADFVRAACSILEKGVLRVTATQNGTQIYSAAWNPRNEPNPISIVLPVKLRPSNNELSFLVEYESGRSSTSIYHVFFHANKGEKGHRRVIVLAPTPSIVIPEELRTVPVSDTKLFIDALPASLRTDFPVTMVVGADATADNIKEALFGATRNMAEEDQLLIYWSGFGSYDRHTHVPLLLTARGSRDSSDPPNIELPNLLSYIESLRIPSTAIIMDTSFGGLADRRWPLLSIPTADESTVESRMKESAAVWLSDLEHQRSLDFLMSSQFFEGAAIDPSTKTSVFSEELAAAIKTLTSVPGSSSGCPGTAALAQRLATSPRLREVGQMPLYFGTLGASRTAFCFTTPTPKALSVSLRQERGQLWIEGAIPSSLELPAELKIESSGVPVRHHNILPDASVGQERRIREQIPLSVGINDIVISVRDERRNSFRAQQQVLFRGDEVVRWKPVLERRPNISVQNPALLGTAATDHIVDVDDDTLGLESIVHLRLKASSMYEVRNNGVLVQHEEITLRHRTDNAAPVTPVILLPGVNSIVISVDADGDYEEEHLTVRLREHSKTVAVLIGIDSYKDPMIPSLGYSTAGVASMKRLLLSSLDIGINDIITLTGEDATADKIRKLLSNDGLIGALTRQHSTITDRTRLADATLLIYYAGYGATVSDPSKHVERRCIVPADAVLADLAAKCIFTKQIDELLDLGFWNDSLLIFDTSYDGRSGTHVADKGQSLRSRTVTSYLSDDEDWRLRAGIAPNRMFAVASSTGQPAFESSDLENGIFTHILTTILTNTGSTDAGAGVSLLDVFPKIQEQVQIKTAGLQMPFIKGITSRPILFHPLQFDELRARWAALLTKAKRDSVMFKNTSTSGLDNAESVLKKTKELFPDEASIQTGLGLVARYRASMCFPSLHKCKELEDSVELLEGAAAKSRDALVKLEGNEQQVSREYDLYEALVGLVGVYQMSGRTDQAIQRGKEALSLEPGSLRAKYLLAKAYLSSGDDGTAARILDEILDSKHMVGSAYLLTAEEWGKVAVLRSVLLMEQKKDSEARQILEEYSRAEAWDTAFHRLLATIFMSKADESMFERRRRQGQISVPSLWANEIANYLLGHRSPKALQSILARPLDEKTFQCEYEFYLGINALVHRQNEDAAQHFQNAVCTRTTDRVEYWMAKKRLQRGSPECPPEAREMSQKCATKIISGAGGTSQECR
jgi:tetratricopeptide (TPR) repeat protein